MKIKRIRCEFHSGFFYIWILILLIIKFNVVYIALVFVLLGCTAKKVVVPDVTANETNNIKEKVLSPTAVEVEVNKLVVTNEVLVEGKNLFEANCAKCHGLYNKSDFTAEQWTPILKRMQGYAKISDEQREKVYAYLITP
jgi:cytochrome c5